MTDVRSEIAYLRRYADAAATLAEMAMVTKHRIRPHRFALFYDDEQEEWFVHRLWYDERMQLQEEEMARATQMPDAVEAAYERFGQDER